MSKVKGEWQVSSQYIGGLKVYQVYRLRDVAEIDHAGNREYKNTIYTSREKAELAAQMLNGQEEGRRA